MKMQDIQNIFKNNIRHPRIDPEISELFRPAGRLDLEEAFQVYHESYITRLSESLAETYGAVCRVLGPELFYDLCQTYIRRHPSTVHHLSDYGDGFAHFLQAHPSCKHILCLCDLARFEWIHKSLSDLPNPRPLATERATELLKAKDAQMRLIPALEIFSSPYAISEFWRQPADLEGIEWKSPETLMLHKKESKVHITPINHIEAKILRGLKAGRSAIQILGESSDSLDSVKISELLSFMIRSGIIEDIHVPEIESSCG